MLAFLGFGWCPDSLVALLIPVLFLGGPVLNALIPVHLIGYEAF
jgi:hypothetical protein